jgi:hypothetical protein
MPGLLQELLKDVPPPEDYLSAHEITEEQFEALKPHLRSGYGSDVPKTSVVRKKND